MRRSRTAPQRRRRRPGRPRPRGPVVRRVVTAQRLVALSFDDGPGDWTPALLDLLAAHGARATFFVLGESIAGREATLRRSADEGHELANHGWSHRRSERVPPVALRRELQRTSGEVERATGIRPRLARPPYGRAPLRFAAAARPLGMRTVLWSVDPADWRQPPAETIAARTLRALHPGAVVDLHDGFRRGSARTSSQPTVDALALLLPALAERGYGCVTVSELLRRGRPA